MSIRLLGTLQLSRGTNNGTSIRELSDLAWDEDEQLLYAVSDQGYLLHLQPVFKNNNLADMLFIARYYLLDGEGKPLKGSNSDSEGLDIINGRNGISGDSELIVSFERNPRIMRYAVTGELRGNYTLPSDLATIKNYRGRNRALEAVIEHPEFGIITAPEQPLKTVQGRFNLYNLEGKTWTYTPVNAINGAITAMELLPNGNLVVLERIYSGQNSALSIAIRVLQLPYETGESQIETAALFSSDDGFLIDNFEGLARHHDKYFFMVSDDNENFFQNTLLIYFEILDQ